MILILTDVDEPTTDLVIDWLNYFKKPFIRLSRNNHIQIESIYFYQCDLEVVFSTTDYNGNKITIDTKNITSYWYRRSSLVSNVNKISNSKSNIGSLLRSHMHEELLTSLEILNYVLNKKAKINKYEDNRLQKLVVLDIAKNVGLKIPNTLVTRSKKELVDFKNNLKTDIITKTIGDPLSMYWSSLHTYTSIVDIQMLHDRFGLSLFQKNIKKKFEIRTFFLIDTFYSSAVFSQMDKRSEVDLKLYDKKNPIRIVPFTLPDDLTEKLKLLMKRCDLKSGSIDLIYGEDLEYYFLEVNPIGQFEQVSFPCNYNLFKEVAYVL